MGIGYILINTTKKESITFAHLPASKAWELTINPITSALVTWYLLKNAGDYIAFVPDQYDLGDKEWPLKNVSWKSINEFKEITDQVIAEMIKNNILKDLGRETFDENEPNVYIRKLEIIR